VLNVAFDHHWDGYVLLMPAALSGWFHRVWAGRVVIILILTSLRLMLQLLSPHWQPAGCGSVKIWSVRVVVILILSRHSVTPKLNVA